MTPRELAKEAEKHMQCRCDLDNWEPEKTTGHSWVCPIHEWATRKEYDRKPFKSA